ncbi:FAD-dependent oxidoreductase [Streptomyces muensis]|uniref:FAD-dependent oxidoreductase n=1 Tax=Streptomyces muensis TaxID=1077944 RepID=A0A9X1THA6_STRM4|nr:FAD-dependent oxidoreductase [Streptomyces muensis]MCF1592526.1 FAD-dependent oxidoreductase [Streptomyces muensis]
MGRTSDVVVVGSGGAALSAALAAALEGASVTVLERSSKIGGTTAVSGGGMWLPGHNLDPQLEDDASRARTYLARLTEGLIDETVLDRFIEEAGSIPSRFAAATPLTFSCEVGRPDYHAEFEGGVESSRTVFPDVYDANRLGCMASVLRRPLWPGGVPPVNATEVAESLTSDDPSSWIRAVQERLEKGIVGRGAALIGGLLEGCLDRGVRVLTEVRVVDLCFEAGRAVGVFGVLHGERVRFDADRGVVLASGGFEWDRALWDALVGEPWEGPSSPPFNEGDALRMSARAGARLARLDKVWGVPERYLGEQYEGERLMRIGYFGSAAGEILVNRTGRRFVNEGLNYHDIHGPMMQFDPTTYERPNHPCFAITDARRLDALRAVDTARIDDIHDDGDLIVVADTLAELAGKLGIDPAGLQAQVSEWNDGVERGVDAAFGRQTMSWDRYMTQTAPVPLAPISQPPFVGYRVRAGVFGTLGGPVIDANAQIVSMDGAPIGGLYGAGNAVSSIFANSYPGGGGTLGPAVTMGFVAGGSAARAASRTTS